MRGLHRGKHCKGASCVVLEENLVLTIGLTLSIFRADTERTAGLVNGTLKRGGGRERVGRM